MCFIWCHMHVYDFVRKMDLNLERGGETMEIKRVGRYGVGVNLRNKIFSSYMRKNITINGFY